MILYKNILRTKNVYPFEIRVHEDVIFCSRIRLVAFFLFSACFNSRDKQEFKKKNINTERIVISD